MVQEQDYSLYTFRQFQKEVDEETGKVKITGFEQDLEKRYLMEENDGWHALALGDFDTEKNLLKSETKIVYIEGSKVPVSGSRVERTSQARNACLECHGVNCSICDFDFEAYYGELGKEFIHVHHLNPISESKGEHVVYPKTDLRPVCPNCHAMIHRNGKNRSLEEIRSLVLLHKS